MEDHPDADLYLQLARLHNRAQRWGEAADALGQALARGVDDRADTLMALGVARYRQGRRAAARDAFEQDLFPQGRGCKTLFFQHISGRGAGFFFLFFFFYISHESQKL